MKQTAPLERLTPAIGSSMIVRQFTDSNRNTRPFWHYHPEIELVYVEGGSGKRHIGSHLSYFNEGELVLIGPNLPHQGFTERLFGFKTETVVQMDMTRLGDTFFMIPEMERIVRLLNRSKLGLSFFGETKSAVGLKIKNLVLYNQLDRLLKFIEILKDLSLSKEFKTLNTRELSLVVNAQDNDRINEVFNFVKANFKEQIPLETIAEKVSMTIPSFCRYFKGVTGKTFTKFVNEYRLVHASKLLSEEQTSILDICFESGFNNFSHFTKSFKEFTGKTPSQYRKEVIQIL